MPRPRTPLGSYGEINTVRVSAEGMKPEKWRARTRYRFLDGKSRQVERYNVSEAKAIATLKTALTTIEDDQTGTLTATTSVKKLGQKYLEAKRDIGRTESSLRAYATAVDKHITPALGDLTIREAKAELLQKFLNRIERESGPGAAKTCRSALSGMFTMAAVNGAITHNPVRELERIKSRAKKASVAIPLDELDTFIEKLRADKYLQDHDTVELVEFMLTSGWRVAEACALDVESIDFDKGTATVEAVNVRVKGEGIVRQPFPKTEKSGRVTPLPRTGVNLLRRRHERLKPYTTLLFPTPLMRRRDPSGTQAEIRARRDALGYPELSTHSFRKTVGNMLEAAGMTATEIADFLGHEDPSLTQRAYLNTSKDTKRAADAVEKRLTGLF